MKSKRQKNINILEWDKVFLKDVYLSDIESISIAKRISEKGILEIKELKDGLSVETNSYIGRINIDNIQINVNPKIKGLPLYKLLKYAYGLEDFKLMDRSYHNINTFSFFDLLIYELYREAERLIYRGMEKQYIRKEEKLNSPRGRIDINEIAREAGLIGEKLPCIYFTRNEDVLLNQIIYAGLKLSLDLVVDKNLKMDIQRLCYELEEKVSTIMLTRTSLQSAKNSINRLTRRYNSAIEIINFLYESQSMQLEDSETKIKLSGYFLDMNLLFEKLLEKLFTEFNSLYDIKSQLNLYDLFSYTVEDNPRGKRSPTPRPDFAIMDKKNKKKVIRIMDAKYRDLWERNLPSYMLYQLAIYASSGIGDNTSTILYPSIGSSALIQKIDINNPVSKEIIGGVILQPVDLIKIADLLYTDKNKLIEYIDELLFVRENS